MFPPQPSQPSFPLTSHRTTSSLNLASSRPLVPTATISGNRGERNPSTKRLEKFDKELAPKDPHIPQWVDLNSCYYTVKAALPHFIEHESGKIINISSFVGQAGNFGQTNYASAKASIIGFTKSAVLESWPVTL